MIVFSAAVRRVDPKDERFPARSDVKRGDGSIVGFRDVYLCEMQTSDGPLESAFLMTDSLLTTKTTQEALALMMEQFAAAIRSAGKIEAAV